jgi:hypothetical protein
MQLPWAKSELKRPKSLGTTFSQYQCSYFGFDFKSAYEEVLKLEFDLIRLCAYWNEIEANEGKFNFTNLDWLINETKQYPHTKIVLAVGIKTPRWPEFHFPDWVKSNYTVEWQEQNARASQKEVQELALKFIKAVINRYKDNPQIEYFQIENEPLNLIEGISGGYLDEGYVNQAINLAKKLKDNHQKILSSCTVFAWPPHRNDDIEVADKLAQISDAIGVNVYNSIGAKEGHYISPTPLFWRKLKKMCKVFTDKGRDAWITESQAEPWEERDWTDGKPVHTNQIEYPSASPEKAIKLASKLTELGFETILLWGCEYWYWHKKEGREEWWKKINEYIDSES